QVMQIVRDLGGYSYGRSDLVRRAMGKKKMDVMLQEKEYFIHGKLDDNGNVEIAGCVRNGIPENIAEEIFNQMVSFAEYAFNKSHSAAYAVIAYETAWLKHHYPVEFMAALMTSVMGDSASIAKYIRNCNEMGIEVLPPDVNESGKKFTVKDGKIRFGLLGVKNVGEGAIDAIVRARSEKGLPKDIFQLISNLDIHLVNKKAMESLIRAGALDSLDENRAAHMAVYERLIESAQNESKKNIEGQMSLFQLSAEHMETEQTGGKLPDVENFPKDVLISMEKEMLGVYISDHPLKDYEEQISRMISITSEDLAHVQDDEETGHSVNTEIFDGMRATMAGIVTGKKQLVTKNSKMMAFVDMEDLMGNVEVVVFPNVYEKSAQIIKEDALLVVKGTINFKEGEVPKLLANEVMDLREMNQNAARAANDPAARQPVQPVSDKPPVKIRIPDDMTGGIELIRDILTKHKGDTPVIIYMKGKAMKTNQDLWVNPDDIFCGKIRALVGAENLKV
ncbi:MAG: DNA polymerase III subunit alpha, partial [Firmicutes bacterium]|nr:DNA polymerase III subunit alpha [Bacillota bacterium]